MPKYSSILFFILIFSCQRVDNKGTNKEFPPDKVLDTFSLAMNDSEIKEAFEYKKSQDTSLHCTIDTTEIKKFWNKFILAVKARNKKAIYEYLNFDLFLGTIIPYPKFMKNCDTGLFAKSDEYYGISKLTKNNFNQYFNVIFNEDLIELVTSIHIDSIIKKGTNTGFSYVYSHAPSLKDFPCSHEKVLVVNLFYCDIYKVSIDFCC